MNNDSESQKSQQKLTKINSTLQLLEDLLSCVSGTEGRLKGYADNGWLLSMVAESPGILLAVLYGRDSHSWQKCAREIEKTIMTLRIEKRLLEWDRQHRNAPNS